MCLTGTTLSAVAHALCKAIIKSGKRDQQVTNATKSHPGIDRMMQAAVDTRGAFGQLVQGTCCI